MIRAIDVQMGPNIGGGSHLQCVYMFKARDIEAAKYLQNLLNEGSDFHATILKDV